MLWQNINRVAAVLTLATGMVACGGDKAKEATTTTTTDASGKGSVATASSGQASIDFSTAATGAQFVLMPVILGDVATVTGATDSKFTLTMSLASSSSAKLDELGSQGFTAPSASSGSWPELTGRQRDDALRTLLNRFEPRLGLEQGEDFWALARRLDAGNAAPGFALAASDSIESLYRRAALAPRPSWLAAPSGFQLASSSCPTPGGTVTVPSATITPKDVTIPSAATSVVSTADYCIVYLSEPVTGGDRTAIEATIKAVLTRYKEVIYKDTFPPVNGYTFKPVFTIVDFSNAKLWPTTNAGLQVSGAFIPSMSDDTADTVGSAMPMLYMASDISKVGTNVGATVDATKNKRLWHGTIAHEVQHAIMNYYRARKVSADPKKWRLETAEVDEGIAHYTEDLFGHGAENFDDFAKQYLTTWFDKDLVNPVLSATDDKPLNRGAAQTLIYYLVSQKGGVTFTNGLASGGDGLTYLATVVKGATHVGPRNLSEAFGGAWTDAISNYFGALAIDGSGLAATDAKYTVQDPQKVTNLIGEIDRSYGMHFNNFSGLPKAHTWTEVAKDGLTTPELQYYATCPYLYTVTDPAAKVVFKTKDTLPNTAVAVVQIK